MFSMGSYKNCVLKYIFSDDRKGAVIMHIYKYIYIYIYIYIFIYLIIVQMDFYKKSYERI